MVNDNQKYGFQNNVLLALAIVVILLLVLTSAISYRLGYNNGFNASLADQELTPLVIPPQTILPNQGPIPSEQLQTNPPSSIF